MAKKAYGGEYARRAEEALVAAGKVSTPSGYAKSTDEVAAANVKISQQLGIAQVYAQLHHTEVLRQMAVPVPVPEGPLQDQPTQVWGTPTKHTDDGADYFGIGGHGGDQWDR